ncbi:MAG: NAD(P)/FAD-dependent oxidoreductase [Alphaproteobacteria bacterium]|nr:NAD(P)/FAD-dependent oxidoreductase [Alphaproteobacteria bacterium]
MKSESCDVAVIGAGPAGSVASAMLASKGWDVQVLERQHFPRFSIGESLLAQSIALLDEAGLLQDVLDHGFQYKDGAAFAWGGRYTDIYFPNKSTPGPGTTFQVRRDMFDDVLIKGAQKKGARVSFGDTVTAFRSDETGAVLTVAAETGEAREVRCRFALDASGFGRILPRLLDLEKPSGFDRRRSVFRHVMDNIDDPTFDRNKILVSVNPHQPQIWYWLIPLADGMSSMGAVGPDKEIEAYGANPEERLTNLAAQAERMSEVLKNATVARPANEIVGFAANVKSLVGPSYALLGNAAEFLDPVFSSGVTIAMKSAVLASGLADRQLRGGAVDWQGEFVEELKTGVETFRACVGAWYDGSLQRIIFNRPRDDNQVTAYLTSVLAGYAWDKTNPLVREPARFLRIVDELCEQA